MAKYRTKTPIDLSWNRLRRKINYEVNLVFADEKEAILNDLFTDAQQTFNDATLHDTLVTPRTPELQAYIRRELFKRLPREWQARMENSEALAESSSNGFRAS